MPYYTLSTPLPPPTPTLFPYTTLFRSDEAAVAARAGQHREIACGGVAVVAQHQNAGAIDIEQRGELGQHALGQDRKSTRLNSSHVRISYAVFCLKKKKRTLGFSR